MLELIEVLLLAFLDPRVCVPIVLGLAGMATRVYLIHFRARVDEPRRIQGVRAMQIQNARNELRLDQEKGEYELQQRFLEEDPHIVRRLTELRRLQQLHGQASKADEAEPISTGSN